MNWKEKVGLAFFIIGIQALSTFYLLSILTDLVEPRIFIEGVTIAVIGFVVFLAG